MHRPHGGETRFSRCRRLPFRGFAWAIVSVLASSWGCDATPTRTPPQRADIVIIVLDTVRWDRLSAYGYRRQTSPEFDRFASEGRLFRNAYASGGWTTPSHASFFTGFHSIRHGATQEDARLRGKLRTLAEILSTAGYETMGITGNPMITRNHGFAQGFERYQETWRGVEQQTRDSISVEQVESFLADRDPSRPFFLFLNLFGAHTPYDSCGASCGYFGARLGDGIVDSQWHDFYLGRRSFSEEEYDRLDRLYDQEVREVDRHLGRVLRAMERHRSERVPFIVVTSDHGENIGDHRHVNHVFTLYETTIRIPLVVRSSGRVEAGSVEERAVQLVDLFPTLLRVAGISPKLHEHHGHDLLSEDDFERPIVTEYYRPDQAFSAMRRVATRSEMRHVAPHRRRIRTVMDGGWKLHWGSDGRHELYELATDPHEQENRIHDPGTARITEILERQLVAFVEQYGEGRSAATQSRPRMRPKVPLDPETEAALRALGYVD